MAIGDAAGAAPRILDCGDTAVIVDFGNVIDPVTSARVLALDEALVAAALPGVVETVPGYRSLMIHVDPGTVDHDALYRLLETLGRAPAAPRRVARRWQVPVVYGGAFGEDLEDIARRHDMTPDQVVRLHSGSLYRVYMVGFMPGFSYLGGMDPRLATPRRESPRLRVPASAIAIGGAQTSVGSLPSPSGWHLIGRTPVRPFMPERTPGFLFAPGDEITFTAISPADWDELDAAAAAGERVAQVSA